MSSVIEVQCFEEEMINPLRDAHVDSQKKTFTKWANGFLDKAKMEIGDLFEDLSDGKILMKLLEIISGESLGNHNMGKRRVEKLDNIDRCLKFLQKKVRFENIGAEDIMDGKPHLILGLIWTIILRFQIQEIEIPVDEDDKSSEKRFANDALLLWCQRKTAGYPGVEMTNFTTSWQNGLGFNALIHAYKPDMMAYDELIPTEHMNNLNNAFYAADKLGIPSILDAEDIDCEKPDEKSIITYVASYYHFFTEMTEEMNIAKTRQSSDIMTHVGTSFTVEPTPEFSKTLENQIMNESDTVTLECQLSKPNQAVQWTKNGKAIVLDYRIIVISDTYKHQLIIRDVTLEDAGKFSCVYDNTRTECTLTVKELALQLTKKLEDLAVTETLDVTLECQLNKSYKNVQWEMNANQVRPDDRINVIADKFIHKLLIRNVTPEDSGIYRCVCDSIRTCCSLTVKEFETTFTKKLKNQVVHETETLTLECQLSKPNKTAEWTKNNLPIVQDDRIAVIVDVHKHQLNISGVMLEDAGVYACVYGNVKTECTINLEEIALAFTRTLKNQTVNETATVNLECRLSKPNKTVQWAKDGDQICPDDRISVTVAIYTHRLVIQDVKMADAGNFQCVCGNVGTHCTLTIIESTEQTDCFDLRKHINWIKTSVSLCFLKEGITAFSNGMAANFHKDVRERVSLKQPNAATKQCKKCTHMQARQTKGKDKNTTWRMNCSMNICSVWLEEILPYHRHKSPKIEWKNSDPRLWPSHCWDIVKIFQPYGCEHQHKAEDCDATGLLTLILDCQFFSKFISNPQHLQEIKDVRNVCMHSKDLIMNDTEMKQSLNLMVTFLGEKELQKYQSAIDAAKKIKQLRDGQLDVTLIKTLEERIIKEKLAEVKQNITRLENTDKNLCGATGRVSAKQDTYKKEYRKRLEEFKETFSKAKNTIGTFIKKKNPTIRKQFITLINRLQELEQDNREVDEYYQAKVFTLGSEEKHVNSEALELIEKPETRQSVTTESTPWFTMDLQNQTVYERATVTLECQLSQPDLTVTWLKGVTQVCSNDHIITETENCIHRLIIRDLTLEDAGKFWCFCDEISSYCTLQVDELPPEFITKLENHTAIESGTVTLECMLSKPNTTVQWIMNRESILPDDRITVTADTFIHRLVITEVSLEDAGNFQCFCDTDSTQCILTVNELANDIIKELENQTEKESGTVTLTCILSRPNKKVVWMKDGQQVISDYHTTITVDKYTHQLIIRDMTLEDAGNFRCVCAGLHTECTLTVEELTLKFVKQLDDTTGYIKSKTTLSCKLSRSNQRVTWRKKGKVVSSNDNLKLISGIFSHQLVFSDLTRKDAGKYTCTCGNVLTTAKLTIKEDDDPDARQLEFSEYDVKSAENLQKAVLKKRSALQQLTIWDVDLSSLGDKLSDVITLPQLVKLELRSITLSHEQYDGDQDARQLRLVGYRESAKDVQKAVLKKRSSLQQLTLQDVDLSSLGDKLSDVIKLPHLVQLEVAGTTLCHEQWQTLGRDLRQSPQLRELSLYYISCTTHGKTSGCVDLDLGGPLRLHRIALMNLPFTQVVFNLEVLLRCVIELFDNVAGQMSTLQNLLAARNLQKFSCYYVSDAAAVSKLVNVLPQLHRLQQLELWYIDFGSVTDIRLSATMDQLESVDLRHCQFEGAGLEQLLHQDNLPQRRVKITLLDVTIGDEEDVINKIRQSPDTNVVVDDVENRGGEWWVGRFEFYTRY